MAVAELVLRPLLSVPRARHPSCARQAAGVEELLRAFDVVRAKHEGMDAGEYNADGTYKDVTILVTALRPAKLAQCDLDSRAAWGPGQG